MHPFVLLSDEKQLISDIILSKNKQSFFHELYKQPRWAVFYEMPFAQHLSLAFKLLRLDDFLHTVATAENIPSAFVQELTQATLEPVQPEKFNSESESRLYFSALFSMLYSFRSLSVWGQSLNQLIAAKTGDDQALFRALEIDRSCLTVPSVAARIGKAMILDDQDFFQRVSKAINRNAVKRRQANQEERFTLVLLQSFGLLDKISTPALIDLLVGIGVVHAGDDERTKKFIRDWKKEQQGKDMDLNSLSSFTLEKAHKVFSHIVNDIEDDEIWQYEDTVKLLNT